MAITSYAPGQELSSIDFHSMIGGPLGAIVDAQAQAALSTVDFIKSVGFTPDSEDVTTGEITPGTPVYVSFKYPKMVKAYEPEITGVIVSMNVTNGGADYTDGEVVSISGGGGSGATATVTVNNGEITALVVTNGGSGYTDGGNVSISGTGAGATATISSIDSIAAVPAVFNEMQLEVPILTMLPIPFIRVEEGEIDFHAKITSMEYANVGSTFKASTSFGYSSNSSASLGIGKLLSLKKSSSVNFKVNASYQRTSRQGNKVDKTFQLGVKVKVSQDEIPAGMEKLLGILEDAIVSQPTGG